MATASLLLGSGSPRRREILANLRVPFVVHVADADETVHEGEAPAPYLERVVLAKLRAVGKVYRAGSSAPHDVRATSAVLVADTSVIDDGAILGKPANAAEAEAMISRLAGRSHEVWTRFAIGRRAPEGEGASSRDVVLAHAETVITRVTFRALTPLQVRAYAESGEGLDKAGAYAVQGLGAGIVARIEGSYTNVVGLPACEVIVALEELGLAAGRA